MIRIVSFMLVTTALIYISGAENETSSTAPGSPDTNLVREIRDVDSKLFDAVFKNCDAKAVEELVTDDFEFYHDKSGLIATNGAQFVQRIRESCERQKSGQEGRTRRELVDATLQVYPLQGYGAVQVGEHKFFSLKQGQPPQPSDIARFTHLWKKETNGWRLARVISYDHKPQ